MPRLPSWISSRNVLLLTVLLGVILRLTPCLRQPDFQWVADAAYHGRLIRETVSAGRVPEIDRLSNAPVGRRTDHELPIGLYPIGALVDRGLAALGMRDARWSLALLIALSGGLIAVPAWLAARAVFGNPRAADLAALISVFLPAHLVRSYGYWLRYDAPGTLLVVTHCALALMALSSARVARRRGYAVGAAVFLVAALWVWRVSLIVLLLELAFVMFRLATRGAEPALRDLWIAIIIFGTAGALSIDYLREQRFALSPLWLGSIGSAIVLAVTPLGSSRRWPIRTAALAVVAGLAIGIGRSSVPAGYSTLAPLVRAKLGMAHGHDPATALMLAVEELRGMSVWTLVSDPQELFLLGAWLVAAPVLFVWLARVRPRPPFVPAEPSPALLAFLVSGLTVSTLLFVRTSAILAPFAAITLGGLGARLGRAETPREPVPPRSPQVSRRKPGNDPRGSHPAAGARRVLGIAFAMTVAATLIDGAVQATLGFSHLPGEKAEALRFLSQRTPRDAVVLSLWDDGYDIQAHAGRATVVDGLLESVENRSRIIALDRAWMEPLPDSLARFCDRYGATWMLVPPASFVHGVASVAGDPIAVKIERGVPLVAGVDTRHVLMQLMLEDAPVPGFRLAYRAGAYRVYERATPP